MKAQALSAFLALAASLQQASAGWSDAPSYKCPKNSCDKCTTQQSSGFDWGDLNVGDFSFYGGFEFEGFTCLNSFGKRDLLTGRTFGSKCISGTASSEPEKCPKASCHDMPSFSIDTLEISVEFDVDLEFHYGMDDGSTCKHKSSCSKEGTSVKNTQCGGAKNVTVVLPSPPASKPTCSVGIHSIGFNCPSSCTSTTKATSTPKPYTTPSADSTTTPVVTTPASSTPTSQLETSTSAASIPSSSLSTAPASTTTPTYATSSSVLVSVVSSSSAASNYSSSSSSSSVASSPVPSSSPLSSSGSSSVSSPVTTSVPAQSVTTVIVDTTVTTCPVTNIHTTGGTTSVEITNTVSTITTTRTSTICTKCEASATAISTTSTSPAQPSVSCPAVLPSCLNTWMQLVTDCTSIDDYNCFCPSSNLTTLVFECLSAHGASNSEISSAQTYFQGICAEYVPQNPAIVTAASALGVTTTIAGPVITIDVYTTLVVPCTQSNGPASTTTIISSAITVPQVLLTTITGSSVGLVQGTQAPAATTAAAGVVATTMATVAPTNGVAGSTGTITASPSKFTGAASRSNVAFGVVGAAFAFSFFAM